MRVISGKRRGAKLIAPEGMNTRPTTDRIKETLFNMIQFDLPGCQFLDLFSGSGGIGIEAISRGAQQAVFIDKDPAAFQCIKKNLEKTTLQDQAIVYNIDVYSGIKKLVAEGKRFDIIFLDPPYALPDTKDILAFIGSHDLLKDDGYLILEQGTDQAIDKIEGLKLIKEKQYKTTTMSFFERIMDK